MKHKALMSTSLMLIASRALAASADLNAGSEVIDAQKIKEGITTEVANATNNDTKVLLQKNIIKNDLKRNHEAVSKAFGADKKSLNSKYYGDLVERLKLAQNAANDSTNLTSTDFQTPTGPEIGYDSCHGVCHGGSALDLLKNLFSGKLGALPFKEFATAVGDGGCASWTKNAFKRLEHQVYCYA